MIPVIIFFGHAIFAVWAFAKSYQNEGWLQAILNVVFIIILFTVGWTVSDLLISFIISPDGYEVTLPVESWKLFFIKISGVVQIFSGGYAKLVPKDAVSLIFLTILEYLFYKFYFKRTTMK